MLIFISACDPPYVCVLFLSAFYAHSFMVLGVRLIYEVSDIQGDADIHGSSKHRSLQRRLTWLCIKSFLAFGARLLASPPQHGNRTPWRGAPAVKPLQTAATAPIDHMPAWAAERNRAGRPVRLCQSSRLFIKEAESTYGRGYL